MHPQRIGRYEIRGVLGQGGMATVYRAYDPLVKREVALKVIQGGLDVDPAFRERMIREAQAIAALEHPAVVPIYDFGESDGALYMVMRLMQGGSLKERLRRGPLSPEETLQVVRRLASALDEAHRLGIVHRDLKPGNVLFDRFGNAYLADFGVARLSGAGTTLTGGHTLGTPAYMSPEQAQGAKDLDGRSDVYALGAMIYQMLTGQWPYQGDTPVEIMLKHIQEPPPDLRALRPDLPEAVAEVIRRAMAKAREERYPTAGALAEALEIALRQGRLVTPEETTTRAAPVTAEATRALKPAAPSSRSRPWVLWLVLSGLLLGVGAAGAWWLWGSGAQRLMPPLPSPSAPPPATLGAPSPLPAVLSSPTPLPPPTNPPSPTPSPQPSATFTPSPMVVGGADLLAFVGSDHNIYLTTLDGSQVHQLTTDGASKRELQWVTHNHLLYLSGKCVFLANLRTNTVDRLICFPTAERVDGFRVSPDGKQVAVTVEGSLFIARYDPQKLRQITGRSDLFRQGEVCATFNRDEVLEVRWARDGKTVSARVRVPAGGRVIEAIEVLRIDCQYGITRQHVFPAGRFEMTTYERVPRIPSFDWDGDKRYVFNLFLRNGGYGDLYLYSRETYRGELINPIEGQCCYRDPRWSPDGRYLLVTYQDMRLGQQSRSALYLIPAGTWGTGMTYAPLPLPKELFSDPRLAPAPALRPAQP